MREKQKKIIFDLAAVTHIDSTGIGIIMMSAGQLKEAEESCAWRALTGTWNKY